MSKKKSKKEIEAHYAKELNDFMHKYDIKEINFGKHKLKRKENNEQK